MTPVETLATVPEVMVEVTGAVMVRTFVTVLKLVATAVLVTVTGETKEVPEAAESTAETKGEPEASAGAAGAAAGVEVTVTRTVERCVVVTGPSVVSVKVVWMAGQTESWTVTILVA